MLLWNNFKFTESCKDITEFLCFVISTTMLPPGTSLSQPQDLKTCLLTWQRDPAEEISQGP